MERPSRPGSTPNRPGAPAVSTTQMTQGDPARLLIAFGLPLFFTSICQQLYTVADSVIVGRLLGVNSFAALGAAYPCYWLTFSILLGFSQGFGILFAQRFGAREPEGLRRAAAQSILLTAGLSVLLLSVTLPLIRPALSVLNTPLEIIAEAEAYLLWVLAGIPVFFLGNTLMALLRAVGNGRAPLVSVILSSIINIGLDLVFILVFDLGVRGAAAATVIAGLVSLLYCLRCLVGVPQACPGRQHFRYDRETARALLRLSLPLAFQSLVINTGGMLVQVVVNGYGTLYIAGISAAHKYFGVINLVGFALDGAIVVYVGQNYGAKQYDRIRMGVQTAVKIAVGSSLVITALTALLGRWMIALLLTGEAQAVTQVVEIGYRNLLAITVCLPALYLLFVYRSALQGMGNITIPMLSGFTELGMRLLSVLVLTRYIGVWGVYWADGIGWLVAALLLGISYYAVYKKHTAAVPMP